MHRSQWGQKKGQERILAIRISRAGWEKALSLGVLTHPEQTVFPSPDVWRKEFESAPIHIQWDTERSLRGKPLNQFSIHVGISRKLIKEYVDEWILEFQDLTRTTERIRKLILKGEENRAR